MKKETAAFLAFAALSLSAHAQLPPQASEYVEVTATRIEEDLIAVPVSVTVVDGETLRASGARSLAEALSLAGGVTAAQGSDAGPLSAVPELWGLREIDAFLLVVDGVPRGGVFNPATETVDLRDVERIEILRGSAPVLYGGTAFSGVIQVIHAGGESRRGALELSGGSFGSGSASAAIPLSGSQRLLVSADRVGFKDDRTNGDRFHLLYRVAGGRDGRRWHLDADAMRVNQDPASPIPRAGRVLDPRVGIDENYNPDGARLDSDRIELRFGYESLLAGLPWTTTLSLATTQADTLRGFIAALDDEGGEGEGYRQSRRQHDLYADSHVVTPLGAHARAVVGADLMAGRAEADSHLFDYEFEFGGPAPQAGQTQESTWMRDSRLWASVYATTEWTPSPGWRLDAGLRLGGTRESRATEDADGKGSDEATRFDPAVTLGVSRRLAESNRGSSWLFADVRRTTKAVALDFGPEAEPEIADPERAWSYEVGVKGRSADDRLEGQVSAFLMDMENLQIPQEADGLPSLGSGGKQRFKGFEGEVRGRLTAAAQIFASYARHDARFRDYEQEFDGVPTQLAGKRLEMSPSDLAAFGLTAGRATGLRASAALRYTGPRYLNKRNTALAGGFTTVAAGLGWAASWGEVRLDAENLTDRREPVAESEMGDAQYYVSPARRVTVSFSRNF